MSATNVNLTVNKGRYPGNLKDLGLLTIRLGEKDNVLTALADIETGKYLLNGKVFVVQEKVPRGFKIAIAIIKKGSKIYKYNCPIGIASRDIEPGSVVHIHNVTSMVKDERQQAVRVSAQ